MDPIQITGNVSNHVNAPVVNVPPMIHPRYPDTHIEFRDWIRVPITGPIAVLGAGPTMNRYDRDTFMKLYPIVIGVNWVYLNFDVTYSLATHYFIVDRVFQRHDCPCLVYSSSSPDTLHQFYSPVAPGIRYDPGCDLYSGSSTIITAMHLATMLTVGQIDVYGCDLTFGDPMYYKGYHQESGRKPDRETFEKWARNVAFQVGELEKKCGVKFNTVK